MCFRELTSRRVFSAIILCIPIPAPSITASRIAHPMAEFRAALTPPLTASAPPVRKPAMTVPDNQLQPEATVLMELTNLLALQGSSFRRTPLTAQSKLENKPAAFVSDRFKIQTYALQTTPDTKVASEYRCPSLESGYCSNASFAIGRIAEALYSMPYSTSDTLKDQRKRRNLQR